MPCTRLCQELHPGEVAEEEGKEEMLHCSLDSIDRIGDSHLLPLQFGKES